MTIKRFFAAAAVLALSASTLYSQGWAPAGDRIRTKWAEEVNPSNPLPEYPRPQLVRTQWQNLNGLWNYCIVPDGAPAAFDQGKILVPFCIESSLSGVGKRVSDKENLWYQRSFDIPKEWKGKKVKLNFGAVDWKAEVFVNDIFVGEHKGGYSEFSFDITPYLNAKGSQDLKVKVTDCTDNSFQPRGKQSDNPRSIWYTPVTGIWQTVWIEPVNEANIESFLAVADLANSALKVSVAANGVKEGDWCKVEILEGCVGYNPERPSSNVVATAKASPGKEVSIVLPEVKTWSPDSPYLYGLRITLMNGGKACDTVNGYAAMREISIVEQPDGTTSIKRMALNGDALFQYGPLDQGWWPDGLYTAPTDEALRFDIEKTRDFGYNMIRKHVKVEPARWYYHCDVLGMLVWQDMPSTDNQKNGKWGMHSFMDGKDCTLSGVWKANYKREWKEIIESRKTFPCIVCWVPFNEAWGQFLTQDIASYTKKLDPSRLVNPASGGNFRPCGDIMDLHNYPGPSMYLVDRKYVMALGEYGGIGLPVEGHLWQADKNWGYIQYKSGDEVLAQYEKYAEQLKTMIPVCFSAAVYTQTTDVEGEVNGLMTYDRKVIKVDEVKLKEINRSVIASMPALK